MLKYVDLPTMGEILREDFLIGTEVSTDIIASNADISKSILDDLIADKIQMGKELSKKLGKYFGVSELYLLNLQEDINNRLSIRQMNNLYPKQMNNLYPKYESGKQQDFSLQIFSKNKNILKKDDAFYRFDMDVNLIAS